MKIIKIEECINEDHHPVCPWCCECIIDGDSVFECDNPDSIGKGIEPCIESIHPDCPLDDEEATHG